MVGSRMINRKFENLFGRPAKTPDTPPTQKEMDIASSIQYVTEEILIKMVDYAVQKTGIRNLCIAGGVALNCVANGKILKSGLVDRLWIQPASGDSGGALGAAFLAAYQHFNLPRNTDEKNDLQQGTLLGTQYNFQDIKETLKAYGFIFQEMPEDSWENEIAQLIAEGKVVGLFQGRMEFGPRALGSRSILGDPRSPEMQKIMNLKIKYRESFRPFAPMVLKEKSNEWFNLDSDSPYMLLTAEVKKEKRKHLSSEQEDLWGVEKLNIMRSEIPAVTHVDYSARVQTVSLKSNPKAYRILKAFEDKTGFPILINTSFNVRGEPIVCTPFDALKCFMNTEMDVLVLENFILLKNNQPNILKDQNFKNSFDAD